MSSGDNPRVVFLGHSAALSGAELGLADLLAVADGIVPLVLLAEDGPLVERLAALGVPVEVEPLHDATRRLQRRQVRMTALNLAPAAVATSAYSLRLARRLRALRPDLVHANTLKAFLYGAAAARLASVPLVWSVHDRIADDYLPASAARLLRSVARRTAAGVIANSWTTMGTIGPLRAPTAVIYEPVEQTRFAGGRRSHALTEPFTAAIVGRITPWKGQDVFLRAFARAFPSGSERAVVVGAPLFGEEDFLRRLERIVGELGLAGRVEFRGHRTDIPAELKEVDALVHASTIPEPFGRVVVEGMAAGVPVIAVGAGGPSEIVTDGVDGLLYPVGDVARLAEQLSRVAHEPELVSRLTNAASERAKLFTPEHAARETTAFYRFVLARRQAVAA